MRSFQGHSIRSNRVINDDYDDEEHTIVTKFREKITRLSQFITIYLFREINSVFLTEEINILGHVIYVY